MASVSKSIVRSMKNATMGYTQVQNKVRDCTSSKEDMPSLATAGEIAQLTFNRYSLVDILEILDKRLNDKGRLWRHVYKSLMLVEFCLVMGSMEFVDYFRENLYIIRTLVEFQHIDENGRDRGNVVREKAREVTALLNDKDRLTSLRGKKKLPEQKRGSADYDSYDTPRWMEHAGSRYRTSTSATASIAATRKGESKEDEDIRRAIELSLQESNQAKNKQETPVVTDDDLALKMALQESERYVQSQGTVNMPYNTASTSQFNNSNMYGFDGLSNAQFGYGSEFGSTVYATNDPLSLQSQTPAFDVNSAPFDFGNTANPNSQFMFGTAADNAAISKRAAKAELEAQNPFAAQLNAASTDPFGSSDPFGASAKFGNVFDTGKETKPLPFGVDLSGPSAMLAEVARNSNRIDPFANIATKNGSSTTATGIAPSNPFAASQPVSQNFDTDFFPSGYNNSNNNTVDFQSSTLGYGKFNDFTNPGSNLDSNPGSNYGSAKTPHSNTFGSSQNPFI